jgi:hypothetical protein
MVFFNRMFFKVPKNTKKSQKKQDPDNTELESVQQDKRVVAVTTNFDANDNEASTSDSVDSYVPDTPIVNSNPGRSKYRCTYRRTMHYDPPTGRTIGAEATALANYYHCLEETDVKMEFANGGAGIGGGFKNTMEVKPMKYKEVINGPDREAWTKEIENKHDQMVKNDVWEPVKKNSLPRGTKVINSMWMCKKESTAKLCGCLNACRFKQVEGVPYNRSSTHTPVTNAGTIPIILILMLMTDGHGWIVDIKGTFLHGEFENGKVIYMKCHMGLRNSTQMMWCSS